MFESMPFFVGQPKVLLKSHRKKCQTNKEQSRMTFTVHTQHLNTVRFSRCTKPVAVCILVGRFVSRYFVLFSLVSVRPFFLTEFISRILSF